MSADNQKKLTQPPENLKEAIDWVLWMSGNVVVGGSEGTQAIQKLALKIINVLNNNKVTSVNGSTAISLLAGDIAGGSRSTNYKPIESLGNGVRELIGCSSGEVNGGGIGKPGGYQSSYSDQNPSTSVYNDDAAKRFLAFIPLIFFALGFLYWQCQGGWAGKDLSHGPMKDLLVEMGFPAEQLNEEKKGSDVSGMFNGLDELKNVNPTPTFPAFLHKVEEKGKKHFVSSPINVPLYTLCLIALTYMKNKSTLTTDKIPQTKEAIIKTLNKLSDAVKSSHVGTLTKLSNAYLELNTAITDAMNSTESTSSSAGPVSAILTTIGLGGGAAAAYILDIGGAKTVVHSLLKIG
ncbi:variant erythrocyte surface antigen-1 family protein [Babesia caballi]|uniref:Variant erythrocyte surface antigen-1 family protein n=1 Tax=Babesia caballi TaxID=5871 RepID=A0AAV4LP94_BABCB|nr:variant erythrocyte surface antigen-1 family protein [Babesia caballi]